MTDLTDIPSKGRRARADVAPDLMLLLDRLRAYIVNWKFTFVPSENTEYEPGIDREAVDLRDPEANVVSSELKGGLYYRVAEGGGLEPDHRHIVAIDLDIPAYLVPSSTEGHNHLYIDVPGGIAWEDYKDLLLQLAKCKIIEDGYAEVSIKRGHTDLRLPWVSKADQKLATTDEMASRFEGETISPRAALPVNRTELDFDLEPF